MSLARFVIANNICTPRQAGFYSENGKPRKCYLGDKFGSWEVSEYWGHGRWLCICRCGRIKIYCPKDVKKIKGCRRCQLYGDDLSMAYTQPDAAKSPESNRISRLTNSYIINIIYKRTGLKSSDIPPELIKLKREQLKLSRIINER